MKTIPRFVAALFLCALAVTPAFSSTLFTAALSGNVYSPARPTAAGGFGTILLSDDETNITVTLSAFNLSSTPVFSGLFGPGNINSGVPVFLSFFMAPQGGSNYQGFSATPVDQNFVNGLRAGQYLFNIFTQDFPVGIVGGPATGFAIAADVTGPPLYTGGEIGGYINQVPEPASLVLAGLGLLAMTFGIVLKRRG